MSQFYAGFSRVDITPKLGTPLSGYYQTRFHCLVLNGAQGDVASIRYQLVPFEVPSNIPAAEEVPPARHISELHDGGRDDELPYKDMLLTTRVAEAARILRPEHGPASFTMPLTALAIGPPCRAFPANRSRASASR